MFDKKYLYYTVRKSDTPEDKHFFYLTKEVYENAGYRSLAAQAVQDISCNTTINFALAPVP
jgi:hypothetical protein